MDMNHAQALQDKHAGLDRKIREEERRPLPDLGVIAALKKQKLRIKEVLQLH